MQKKNDKVTKQCFSHRNFLSLPKIFFSCSKKKNIVAGKKNLAGRKENVLSQYQEKFSWRE